MGLQGLTQASLSSLTSPFMLQQRRMPYDCTPSTLPVSTTWKATWLTSLQKRRWLGENLGNQYSSKTYSPKWGLIEKLYSQVVKMEKQEERTRDQDHLSRWGSSGSWLYFPTGQWRVFPHRSMAQGQPLGVRSYRCLWCPQVLRDNSGSLTLKSTPLSPIPLDWYPLDTNSPG